MPTEGAAACISCPDGTYSPSIGAVDCLPCNPGSYCPQNGTITASTCPAGSYCPSGAVAPISCPPGNYCLKSDGAPTPCVPGTYSSSSGLLYQSQCTPCPAGTLAGASACSSDLCLPSSFNVNTFHCYTTAGKVGVIMSYTATLFSIIFFPFKMRMMYSRRKAKLEVQRASSPRCLTAEAPHFFQNCTQPRSA